MSHDPRMALPRGSQPRRAWNIAIWIAQAILAAFFLMAGTSHLIMPLDELVPMAPWAKAVSLPLVRFIGFAELLGGIGLLVPSLLRIKPQLSYWAAIGLATIMIFAMVFHISRGEGAMIGIHAILLLLAGFTAWGRKIKAIIPPRSA